MGQTDNCWNEHKQIENSYAFGRQNLNIPVPA